MSQIRTNVLIAVAACVCWFAGLAGLGYRARLPRRPHGCRAVCLAAALAAVLAAFGVPAVWQSVALASSSSVLNWTRQAPAASPTARETASVAYDAATGNVVLFGGEGFHVRVLADTWVWDGTIWAQQHPAASPPARQGASMAYDAATGNVVLFGGYAGALLSDTWTWGSG